MVLNLGGYPERQWVDDMIDPLQNGMEIGFSCSRVSVCAPNLSSASEIVTQELQNECTLGRMAGPYSHHPLHNGVYIITTVVKVVCLLSALAVPWKFPGK